MSVNHRYLEQARLIHQTVRMLQERLVREYINGQRAQNGEAPIAELTFPQCNAMMTIRDGGPMSVKALAEALQVSPPSASAMVDRLVDLGMVHREQSRVDRREVQIRLSERGRENIEILEEQLLRSITDLLERIGPDYADQWCAVYDRIRRVLEAEKASEPMPAASESEVRQ